GKAGDNFKGLPIIIIRGGENLNEKPTKNPFFILDLACIIIIIGMIGYTFYSIMKMPETIPIHLTDGEIDGWGSKWISLLMPGIIVIVYLFFTFFSRYLRKRNQSTTVTKWAVFGCVVLFSIPNFSFIQFAIENNTTHPNPAHFVTVVD